MRPLVVLGDTLLDIDAEGTVDRLCPEAPVPVVDLARRWLRPGGAGLAAVLAARSAAEVVLVTALGDDEPGRTLTGLLEPDVTVLPLPLHGGTVSKTRVRAGGQSLLRLDSGDGTAAAGPLPARVAAALRGAGAILVADYGRGLTRNPDLRRLLGELAGRIPVVWDPHPRGTAPVAGVRLVTPNAAEGRALLPGHGEPADIAKLLRNREAALKTTTERAPAEGDAIAAGCPSSETNDTDDSRTLATRSRERAKSQQATELAKLLRVRWHADAVAVTLGEHGAALAESTGETAVPVPPAARVTGRVVPDTCGAGDRFAAAATGALLEGAETAAAVGMAVEAAARFVTAGGASALSTCDTVLTGASDAGPATDAFGLAERVRSGGGRLIATGGCFDLLHPGHVSLLRQARALGDALVVCLNSDASVRGLKGPGRPLMTARDRARLLTALSCVDEVVVFDEPSPLAVLDRLRPDVWVKGGDYTTADLPEREVLARHGEIVLIPTLPGYSTTRLVAAAAGH